MQTKPMEDFAETLQQLYVEQNYDGIAKHYAVPGALYLEDDVIVWDSHDNLVRLLRSHCAINRSLGVSKVTASIAAEGFPGRNHVTFWVDWCHEDKNGARLFPMKVRYFCQVSEDGTPVIQLVEVPQQPDCMREMDIDWTMSQTVSDFGQTALI